MKTKLTSMLAKNCEQGKGGPAADDLLISTITFS